MSKKTWIWILAACIVIVFGTYWYEYEIRAPIPVHPAQQAQSATSSSAAGIANPASVNCVSTLGGTLEIQDEANGQVGYCHLKDGRVCEEWALFRDGSCTAPQQ
jgi:putative hemolysin